MLNNHFIVDVICESDYCMNGGACLYPHGNCSCTDQWTGDRCQHCMSNTTLHRYTQLNTFTIAICTDGFCMNGGNCLYPDVNCSCPENWSGNKCQIGI